MPEGIEVRRAARVESTRTRQVLARLPRRDAWRQVDQRREVTAVQRQLLDRALFDDRADLRRVGADERRRRHHGRRLLDAPDLQSDVDPRALIDLQDDAFANRLLEALHVDFDCVGARHQKRRRVVPAAVGHVARSRALVHFPDRDGSTGHDAAGIADRADNRSGRDLRASARSAAEDDRRARGRARIPSFVIAVPFFEKATR
jgi:hypothetical protein